MVELHCFVSLYLLMSAVAVLVRTFFIFIRYSTGSVRSSYSGYEERVCSYSGVSPHISASNSTLIDRIVMVGIVWIR